MTNPDVGKGRFFEPEPADRVYKVPLIRVRPKKPISIVCLNPFPAVVYTHWNGKTTIDCPKEGCEFCRLGCDKECKLYIAGWSPNSDKVGVVELPYSALTPFQKHYVSHLTCYAWHVDFARPGENKKGPVCVLFKRVYAGTTPLPEGPDPQTFMRRVWDKALSPLGAGRETGSKTDPDEADRIKNTVDSFKRSLARP